MILETMEDGLQLLCETLLNSASNSASGKSWKQENFGPWDLRTSVLQLNLQLEMTTNRTKKSHAL